MTTKPTTPTLDLLLLSQRLTANVSRHLPDMCLVPATKEYEAAILEDARELAGILKAHPGIGARLLVEDVSQSLLRFLANLEFRGADKDFRADAYKVVAEVIGLSGSTSDGLEGFDADLYLLVSAAVRSVAELNEIPELFREPDWKHTAEAYRSLLAVSEYLASHPEAEGAGELVVILGELLEILIDGPADLFTLVDGEWGKREVQGLRQFADESQYQRFLTAFPS